VFCILINLIFLNIEVALLFEQFQLVGWLHGWSVMMRCIYILMFAAATSDKSKHSRSTVAETAYSLTVPEYEELTPCLKEVTKTWEQMINTPDRFVTKFDPEILTDAVRQGLFLDLLE